MGYILEAGRNNSHASAGRGFAVLVIKQLCDVKNNTNMVLRAAVLEHVRIEDSFAVFLIEQRCCILIRIVPVGIGYYAAQFPGGGGVAGKAVQVEKICHGIHHGIEQIVAFLVAESLFNIGFTCGQVNSLGILIGVEVGRDKQPAVPEIGSSEQVFFPVQRIFAGLPINGLLVDTKIIIKIFRFRGNGNAFERAVEMKVAVTTAFSVAIG